MERESTPVISALKCRQRSSVPRVVETRVSGRYPSGAARIPLALTDGPFPRLYRDMHNIYTAPQVPGASISPISDICTRMHETLAAAAVSSCARYRQGASQDFPHSAFLLPNSRANL